MKSTKDGEKFEVHEAHEKAHMTEVQRIAGRVAKREGQEMNTKAEGLRGSCKGWFHFYLKLEFKPGTCFSHLKILILVAM